MTAFAIITNDPHYEKLIYGLYANYVAKFDCVEAAALEAELRKANYVYVYKTCTNPCNPNGIKDYRYWETIKINNKVGN